LSDDEVTKNDNEATKNDNENRENDSHYTTNDSKDAMYNRGSEKIKVEQQIITANLKRVIVKIQRRNFKIQITAVMMQRIVLKQQKTVCQIFLLWSSSF